MSEPDAFTEITHRLARTAQAHHEATGGVNAEWARWYAEHLIDDLNDVLGSDMSVGELADWLTKADRRYQEEPQDQSWPKAYAAWLIAEQKDGE